MPDSTKSQQPKLLDQVRQVLRLHHYSIHTERSYVDWIVRFVRFHRMRSRQDLFPAEAKIESFLTDLAVHANVSPATQNQAMNALVFLYKRVLDHPLQESIDAVRADKKINIPVVMTREEVAAVIAYGRNRPSGRQAPLRQRAADYGSGPAQGQPRANLSIYAGESKG